MALQSPTAGGAGYGYIAKPASGAALPKAPAADPIGGLAGYTLPAYTNPNVNKDLSNINSFFNDIRANATLAGNNDLASQRADLANVTATNPYSAPTYKVDPNAITSQYDLLRSTAKDQANQSQNQELLGLQRRFASLGQGNSGAAIRAQANLGNATASQLQDANNQIGFAQAGETQRQQDIVNAQNYATNERLGSQQFADIQGIKQNIQQTSERIASNDLYAGLQQQAVGQAVQQWDLEFNRDSNVTEFNKQLANNIYEQNSKGLLDNATSGLPKDATSAAVEKAVQAFQNATDDNKKKAAAAALIALLGPAAGAAIINGTSTAGATAAADQTGKGASNKSTVVGQAINLGKEILGGPIYRNFQNVNQIGGRIF